MYVHYATNKIENLEPREYQQRIFWKPSGLWLSKDDAWMNWCQDNGFATFDTDTHYKHQIEISKNAKLYKINSLESLVECVQEYNRDWLDMIDDEYDGIIFDNYQQVKRELCDNQKLFHENKYIWFLGIDIDSACVWNTSILKVTSIEHFEE